MTISVFDSKENIVGKGENAGYQQCPDQKRHVLTHSHTMTPFDASGKQAF